MSDGVRHIVWQLFAAPWWQWAAVVAAISFAVWLTFRIRALFGEGDDPAAESRQMLMQFDELHRQGDLTEEEFRLIRRRLVGRMESTDADSKVNRGERKPIGQQTQQKEDDSSATTTKDSPD